MVGLTNDERCLIHDMRVEKHWGSEKNIKKNEMSTFTLGIIKSKW